MYLKKTFTFLTAFILAICFSAFIAKASPPTAANQANNMQKNMQIVLIGSGSIGTQALTEIIAAHPGAIIVAHSDYDGDCLERTAPPIIASRFGAIPIATAEQIYRLIESEKPVPSVADYQSPPTIYRMPPDINSYSGQRVDNLIRADTR